MKKITRTIFCITVALCIFPVAAFSNDFSEHATSIFQELLKLNREAGMAYKDRTMADFQKENGERMDYLNNVEVPKILNALPEEYCSEPQMDLLKEFMRTLIGVRDEYPSYVFGELYACDPDRIIKEIMSLPSEDRRTMYYNLDWGFKNIAYKVESLPNYSELVDKLENLGNVVRNSKKSE